MICYTASEEVRNERLFNRDGKYMTDEQANHPSEMEIDQISQISNATINTDDLTVDDQTLFTLDYVNSLVGAYA